MEESKKEKKGTWKYFPTAVVLIVATAALLVVYEKTAQEINKVEPLQQIDTSHYYSATFTDVFSSLAWIDADLTTLRFDKSGMEFVFPPFIKSEEIVLAGIHDSFVPEKAIGDEKGILLLGYDQIDKQKLLFFWQPNLSADRSTDEVETLNSRDKWLKYDFNEIGFNESEEIIKVQPLSRLDLQEEHNEWLVFNREPATESIIVYRLAFINNQLSKISEGRRISIGVGSDSLLLSDVQIICGEKNCLIHGLSSSGKNEFWNFNLQTSETTLARDLSDKIEKQKPEQIVIVNLPPADGAKTDNNQPSFIIGWVKDKEFEIILYRGLTSLRKDLGGQTPEERDLGGLTSLRKDLGSQTSAGGEDRGGSTSGDSGDQTSLREDLGGLTSLISQTTEYSGTLNILPLDANRIFVLWSSYFSRAYQLSVANNQLSVADLTSKFGWRIADDQPSKLYKLGELVYIYNSDGSIMRWDREINSEISQEFNFGFTPNFGEIIPCQVAFRGDDSQIDSRVKSEKTKSDLTENPVKENGGYLIVATAGKGIKIYKFADNGFNLTEARQVVSEKINFSVAAIKAAQISELETDDSKQSGMEYFLSNNGGQAWTKVEVGRVIGFVGAGNDLRWRVRISPLKNTDHARTPYLRSIVVKYWYER